MQISAEPLVVALSLFDIELNQAVRVSPNGMSRNVFQGIPDLSNLRLPGWTNTSVPLWP